MKKTIIGFAAMTAVVWVALIFAQEFEYVGVDKCRICHTSEARGAQYPKWEQRKHSQSYEVLTRDIAQPIAGELGVENPAESPKCMKCHAPLWDESIEFRKEGVSCEVCHGPGSEYKSLSIMKDHEKAVENGLIEYKTEEDIKKKCLTCHENPHGIPFDFKSSWELVKHYRPDKK